MWGIQRAINLELVERAEVWRSPLKNGKANGPYTGWYQDGKKSSEGSYKDGKKDGVWIYYNFDGKYVLYRKTFKEGIEVDLTFF